MRAEPYAAPPNPTAPEGTFSPPSGPPPSSSISAQPIAQPEPAIPSSTPSSEVPRPPATQTGSPLNAAKFGLLPKRPVQLLTPQTSGANAGHRPGGEEDEEELDYVENPFDGKE